MLLRNNLLIQENSAGIFLPFSIKNRYTVKKRNLKVSVGTFQNMDETVFRGQKHWVADR